MNGEYISIETLRIYQDIEKENKELHERIDKAINKLQYYYEKCDGLTGLVMNFSEYQGFKNILNGDIDE